MTARLSTAFVFVTVLALAGPAAAADQGPKAFLQDAIHGDAAETRMGELAQEKAQNETVKEYGRTLAEDHSKAMDEAQKVAESLGVEVPAKPTAEARQEFKKLSGMSGQQFDKQFVQHMVEGHKKTIDKYTTAAKSENAQVAAHAKEVLPVLRKHLETAQSLQKNLGS